MVRRQKFVSSKLPSGHKSSGALSLLLSQDTSISFTKILQKCTAEFWQSHEISQCRRNRFKSNCYRDIASEDIYNRLFFSTFKFDHTRWSTINSFFDLSFCLKENTVSAIKTVSSATANTSQRRQPVSSTKTDTLRY